MTEPSQDPRVAVIMGSKSDLPVMEGAIAMLRELGVAFDAKVVSAHRTPVEMGEFAASARAKGYRVIIAGAGGAAHLPGMVAAHTSLPVIGVPVPITQLSGMDALYSIVQMPKGVPVATVAIGGAHNAGILAAQILASGDSQYAKSLAVRLDAYKAKMRAEVQAQQLEV
ncbi:MAG: 5-(carboxyamino)imidazole ribonucleotide mutase [Deltaproteobacteria bacterium]|nr:5-(carboxyamino)imidazole ribonucleotide mutase [Deltaproteobacteria bacterium]